MTKIYQIKPNGSTHSLPTISDDAEIKKDSESELAENNDKQLPDLFVQCKDRYGWTHPDLRLDFKRTDDGPKLLRCKPEKHNVALALRYHPAFEQFRIKYCEFERQTYLGASPIDDRSEMDLCLRLQSAFFGVDVPLTRMSEAIQYLCHVNEVNSATEWFMALPKWDGVKRIDTWLTDYCGVQDSPIVRAYARRWLISVAKVACHPGTSTEGCLVLKGETRSGKSRVLLELSPKPEWHLAANIDFNDEKKSSEAIRGKLTCEIPELQSLTKSDRNAVKSFLTKCVDVYRASYARQTESIKRQCVFAGTTNDQQFLDDPTGSARFWVVETGIIDIETLRTVRLQLWAEAQTAMQSGERHWLNAEERALLEIHNEQFKVCNPLLDFITENLPQFTYEAPDGKFEYVSGNDLYQVMLSKFSGRPSNRAIGSAMQQLGWKHIKRRINSKQAWYWVKDVQS